MRKIKKIISLLLVFTIIVSMFSGVVYATDSNVTTTAENTDFTVEGTNGFGNLLSSEFNKATEEKEEFDGYGVTDLEIEGNAARITYSSLEEATLVVAIYTEDGMQMVNSAKIDVAPNETEAYVTFEDELPDYFMASAYLLDSYMAPLCSAYDTALYTSDMKELIDSTADDYDQELVFTFDDDRNTNFMVFDENVIQIEYKENVNNVVSVDEENLEYTIGNADEQILSLAKGDIFSYAYENDNILIVKVDSIQISGKTVRIKGAQVTTEEVFAYIKLESESLTSDITVDSSTADESVTYLGMEESGTSTLSADSGVNVNLSHKYSIGKVGGTAFSISGTLTLELDIDFKYYLSLDRKFFEFRSETKMGPDITIKGNANVSVPLGTLGVAPVAGVYIGLEPVIHFEFDGNATFNLLLIIPLGLSWDSLSGAKNLCAAPYIDGDMDIEANLFLGFNLQPYVGVLLNKLMKLQMDIPIGLKLSGEMTGYVFEDQSEESETFHDCAKCLDIDMVFQAEVSGEVKFVEKLSIKIQPHGTGIIPLGQAYYSFDRDEFDWGACPYYTHRITVCVKDSMGNPVEGATIWVNDRYSLTTDQTGVAVFYWKEETVSLIASYNTQSVGKVFGISGPQKIFMKLEKSDDEEGTDESVKSRIEADNAEYTYRGGLLKIKGEYSRVDEDGNEWIIMSSTIYPSVINDMGLLGSKHVKRIVIERNVVQIIVGSFANMTNLRSVEMDDDVEYISSSAFEGCKNLTNIKLSSKLTEIADELFSGCEKLTTISLPTSITRIGESAFEGCNLSSITIPSGVYEIGNNAFAECDNLEKFYVDSGNMRYASDKYGALYSKDYSILYRFPSACKEATYRIPDTVTWIADGAFKNCDNLKSVTIPDTITYIGYEMFQDCDNLVNVNISESVTGIGSKAFAECDNLRNIIIPSSVTYMEQYVFMGTDLENIFFEGSVPEEQENFFVEAFKHNYHDNSLSYTMLYYPKNNLTWNNTGDLPCVGPAIWIPYSLDENDNMVPDYDKAINRRMFYEDTVENTAMFSISRSTENTAGEISKVVYENYPYDCKEELTEEGTVLTVSFSNLMAGKDYILLDYAKEESDELSPDNLLYIKQARTKEDGTLTFQYIQRVETPDSWILAIGNPGIDINNATVTFPNMVDGGHMKLVEPIVVHDGILLEEGTDYVVLGQVSYVEAGRYTCYIQGLHGYTGKKVYEYNVEKHIHKFVDYVSNGDATCTENGTITASCDYGCGETKKITEYGTVKGHHWDGGVVVKKPSAQKTGEMLYTCTGCEETRKEVIPALGICDGGNACVSKHFVDVELDWTHEGIDFAVGNGLFNGTSSTTFSPNDTMTRAMLVTVLWRNEGSPSANDTSFTDLQDDWYKTAVAWAASNGIVNGVGEGKFDPTGTVTREQIATILYRYANYKNHDTNNRENLSCFPDDNNVSSWANEAMQWAVAEGLITGNLESGVTYLRPQIGGTRAMVATIMMRYIQNAY